jgi:hypothetical protein
MLVVEGMIKEGKRDGRKEMVRNAVKKCLF